MKSMLHLSIKVQRRSEIPHIPPVPYIKNIIYIIYIIIYSQSHSVNNDMDTNVLEICMSVPKIYTGTATRHPRLSVCRFYIDQ